MSSVPIIDGDSLVYRGGFAVEKTHYMVGHYNETAGQWVGTKVDDAKSAKAEVKRAGGEIWSRKEIEPVENALQVVKTSIENTLKVLKADEYLLYISGRRNFRNDLFSEYKANRDTATKPKYFNDIRNYLVREWKAEITDGVEADDEVGIAAGRVGARAVVVAQDKDLDQIPGRHYNWTTGEDYVVTPKGGLTFFYEQMLSGDSTDNIPGIDGIGPVKARKALAACTSPQECARVVHTAYGSQDWGMPPDMAIERNAGLLWIQRKKDDKHPFWKHFGS